MVDFSRPAGCPKCKGTNIHKTSEEKDRVYWKCYSNKCGKEWQQLKMSFCVGEKEDEN